MSLDLNFAKIFAKNAKIFQAMVDLPEYQLVVISQNLKLADVLKSCIDCLTSRFDILSLMWWNFWYKLNWKPSSQKWVSSSQFHLFLLRLHLYLMPYMRLLSVINVSLILLYMTYLSQLFQTNLRGCPITKLILSPNCALSLTLPTKSKFIRSDSSNFTLTQSLKTIFGCFDDASHIISSFWSAKLYSPLDTSSIIIVHNKTGFELKYYVSNTENFINAFKLVN